MRDFTLNEIERDSIVNHMFPLTPAPPHYLEGVLITISDKFNATVETCSPERFRQHPNHVSITHGRNVTRHVRR